VTDLVVRSGRVSVVLQRRLVVVCSLLVVSALALALLGLCYGAAWVSPRDALAALAGRGDSAVGGLRLVVTGGFAVLLAFFARPMHQAALGDDHDRRRAARHQPGVPVRRSPRGDEVRKPMVIVKA
jgi:hypothetical protein